MKINRKFTDVLFIGIAEEGKDFGDNFNHDAVLILEDENGNKCGSEYISLNEFADYMNDYYSTDDFADLLESKIDKTFNPDNLEGIIIDSEIISWIERFRFSEENKSYHLTDEF